MFQKSLIDHDFAVAQGVNEAFIHALLYDAPDFPFPLHMIEWYKVLEFELIRLTGGFAD